jgi:hydrogenase maturation protein HypF
MSTIVERPRLSLQTSSIGRLFDGVSTIALPYEVTAGGCSQFEGQLAMLLESCCDRSGSFVVENESPYRLLIHSNGPGKADELDWRPLIAAVVADCEQDVAPSAIAHRFHEALAKSICAVSDRHADLPVALCGGVFQNRVLTETTVLEFSQRRQPLALPGSIPPGDGGLAAGQLVVAMARLGRGHQCF